jgi:hypothetical protein
MSAQINIAALTCQLTHLVALSTYSSEPETILRQDKPLELQATVEFGGSGAIALMPLELTIRLDFYARALGTGEVIELGSTSLKTMTDQFTYIPSLKLSKGAVKANLLPEKIYSISAVLRVGAPEGPSFIHGFIDGLTVEVYNPVCNRT